MNRRQILTTTGAASLAFALRTHAAIEAQYKVAVIGHTGRGNYGHGIDSMWLDIPQTQIVAVADADAKGLESELKKLKRAKKIGICSKAGIQPPSGFTPASRNNFICSMLIAC